ncbi:hypothetical protein [Desulfosporosinus meridiei]|uniref:DUF2878 domain-containing protein n=1 Tax=Desulfosporosinus meridiei (strain ATCC BAA-275 / DSM 13257 / KCTC 12902 / NCIMB 13706 / S10) TaxID=768704 RepID=J7ITR9_DESMD|nr:hypothetical protein [Desulfosporosinus meridiei]AFQ43559.1 hypothetical protein Desmer_1579 [Desulfosporosinus meridiei DSM 13257]
MFDLSFYFIFAATIGLATIILIPRNLYKKYLLYGLIFGGIGDTLLVALFHFMGYLNYKNMGETSIFGLFSFWTPIGWTFYFMLFFYFLPVRKTFFVPYLLAFVALNYSVGMVMSQSGLYETIGIYKYIQPFVYLSWCLISVWIFHKSEHIKMV